MDKGPPRRTQPRLYVSSMKNNDRKSTNWICLLTEWAGCNLDRWMMTLGLRVISISSELGQGVIEGIRKAGPTITLEIQYKNKGLVLVDSSNFVHTNRLLNIPANLRKRIQQEPSITSSTRKRKEARYETTIFCRNCGYSSRVQLLESELDGFEWECPQCDYIGVYQAHPRRTNRLRDSR